MVENPNIQHPNAQHPERSNEHKVFPKGEAAAAFALTVVREAMIETFPVLKACEGRLLNSIRFAPLIEIGQMEKSRISPSPTTLPFFELIDPKKTVDQRYSLVAQNFPFYKDPDSTTLYAASELLDTLGRKKEETRIQAIVNYLALHLTTLMLFKLPLEKSAPSYLRPVIMDMVKLRMEDLLARKHISPEKSQAPIRNISRLLLRNSETVLAFRGATMSLIEQGRTADASDIVMGNNIQMDTIALLGDPVIEKVIGKICSAYPQAKKHIPPHRTRTFDISKRTAQGRFLSMGINERSFAPQEDRKETFGKESMQFVLQKYLESELPVLIINHMLESQGLSIDTLRKESESPLDALRDEYRLFLHSSDETMSVDEGKLLYPE